MKLFNEGSSTNQKRYRFRGYYSFKVISDSKYNHQSNFKISNFRNNDPKFESNVRASGQDAVFSIGNNKPSNYINNETSIPLTLNNDSSYFGHEENFYSNQAICNLSAYKYLGIDNNNSTNNIDHKLSINSELCPISSNSKLKKPKLIKMIHLRSLRNKKSVYNIGRWTEEEHRRFIEAILKYGNDWKNVQKHIRTRSSTQSRSHSQKFFLKIKNYDLFDFKDRKPCISSLNELAKNLDEKQIEKMTDLLISYEYQDNPEKKQSHDKMLMKKRKKSIYPSFDFEAEDSYLKPRGSFNKSQGLFNKDTKISNYRLNENRKLSELGNYNSLSYTNNSNDDFKDHFFNVFNQKNRRLSFEDNIFLLFRHAIIEDSQSNVIQKNKELDISCKKSKNSGLSSYDSDDFSDYIAEDSAEESEESNSWVNTIIDFTQNCVRMN